MKTFMHSAKLANIIKRASGIMLACGITFWEFISGLTIFSITLPERACHIPYYAWALSWPVWFMVPHSWMMTFVNWSLGLCS